MNAADTAFAERLLTARAEDPGCLKALAEDHLPLVGALVKRFPHTGAEAEELYQQGCVGLMKALGRYDPAFGVSFSTYAAAMILGEMRMLSRLEAPVHIPRLEREKRSRVQRASRLLCAHLGREPTMDELAATLRMDAAELALAMEDIRGCSMDGGEAGARPLADLLPDRDAWLERLMLRDLVARMSLQDRQLFLLRFRMGCTQTETALRLGLTQVQVSRREALLRDRLRAAWLDQT